MRLSMPIFDQDRTLSISITQPLTNMKQAFLTGQLQMTLDPFLLKHKPILKWIERSKFLFQLSKDTRFRSIKQSIEEHKNNHTAMSNMTFFYDDSVSNHGIVLWRMRSTSEKQIIFPAFCYYDTHRIVVTPACRSSKKLNSTVFYALANIVLKPPDGKKWNAKLVESMLYPNGPYDFKSV